MKKARHRTRALLRPILGGLALVCLATLSSSCLSEEDKELIQNTWQGPGGKQPPPPRNPAPGCYTERFTQPAATITRKLDLLFVVDTSGSLNAERAAVADGVDAFIGALPSTVDYQVGVMLAHSPLSSWSGKLFQSSLGEDVVLRSSSMTAAEIQTDLGKKLNNTVGESASDGGEEGLASLSEAITNSTKLADIESYGFFRSDAAVVIIFVADENDICARYPPNVTPVPDGQGIEPVAFARDCAYVTPESTLNALESYHDSAPLVIGGVIYNTNTYPRVGENEFGYGYAELISLAGGASVNLDSASYREGLENIGNLATVKMNILTQFTLPTHPSPIEGSTVQAFVDAGPVPSIFHEQTNTVVLTGYAGESLSTVDIDYCLRTVVGVSAECQSNSFVAKPNVKLGLSIDPNNGSRSAIISGFQSIGVTPTEYTDAQIISGLPVTDNVTVLAITRKVLTSTVSQNYVDAIKSMVSNGISVVAEYDGAAMMFDQFFGTNPALGNMNPAFEFFSGRVRGGGALLPISSSEMHVTNEFHPITRGLPKKSLNGLRLAFGIDNFNNQWLETPAEFISQGPHVPAGTYPAIMAGRCGKSRVALFPMNQFQVMNQSPINTMVDQALDWVTGQ